MVQGDNEKEYAVLNDSPGWHHHKGAGVTVGKAQRLHRWKCMRERGLHLGNVLSIAPPHSPAGPAPTVPSAWAFNLSQVRCDVGSLSSDVPL